MSITTHNSHPLTGFCKDIQALVKPLNKIGIDYLSYTRVYSNGDRIYLGAIPLIIDDYLLNKKYLKVANEMPPAAQPSNKIIVWSSLTHQDLVQEAKLMGAGNGIFVFKEKTHPDYCESLGFATSQYNESIINSYFNHMDIIKAFTEDFHKDAGTLIAQAEKHKVTLPFNENIIDVEVLQKPFLKSQEQPHSFKLTQRQIDCAKLLLQGMNAKCIARELQLSPRTFEYYLEILKTRLDCKNKAELIFKLGQCLPYSSA